MKSVLRWLGSWLLAALLAFAIGSTLATQFILANVAALGPEVDMAVRLQATGHDLVGLSGSYLPLVSIAFLLGLPIAAGLARFFPGQRQLLYIAAGAVAVMTIHLLIKAVLGLNGVAAVRTTAGLLSQGVAGACGGYLFCRLWTNRTPQA